ncbi:MAG: DHH family phosphoesterase [Kiritimatiellia bacterium]
MKAQRQNPKKVDQIRRVLEGKKSLLIVMQDYPDPDALASAAGLKALAGTVARVQCSIAHGGIIGRSENRALARYLDLNLRKARDVDPRRFGATAMVDTQPGTGNNFLEPSVVPDIVIDHHPVGKNARRSQFTDIRGNYGAASTIIYEYLKEAGSAVDVKLATGLIYGIRSDTQDLGRETTQADIDAFLALYPIANKRMLSSIERERVPEGYFRLLSAGLRNALVYGDCVVANLEKIDNPDMIGEVAELLLRREKTAWVLCFGFYADRALFSLRTCAKGAVAGETARKVAGRGATGGGHDAIGAGQIPLERNTREVRERTAQSITKRFLEAAGRKKARKRALVAR